MSKMYNFSIFLLGPKLYRNDDIKTEVFTELQLVPLALPLIYIYIKVSL